MVLLKDDKYKRFGSVPQHSHCASEEWVFYPANSSVIKPLYDEFLVVAMPMIMDQKGT